MRTRIVLANRQILASDVNEINANQTYNQQVVNDGVIGISKGVISGLDVTSIANTSTVFYIPSGIVSDGNGTFYELLEQTSITMAGGAGTYKAYVQYCTITDTPISGYTLLDVSTRTESFTTVNTRTYDGLTGNITTGTVATNAEHVADVVWNGSAITSITDVRAFVTIASLPAYSLQGFVQTDLNFATIENKVSGYILDDTNLNSVVWSKATIANGHAGIGHNTDVGQNANAVGHYATVSGNVGYKSKSLIEASSGFISEGTSNTGKLFIARDGNIGFISSSNNTGIEINSCINGIDIGNSGQVTGKGIKIQNTVHPLQLVPLSSNPTSATTGEIAVVDVGGKAGLKFHNGDGWLQTATFGWGIATSDSTFTADNGIIANKGTVLTYALPTTSITGQVIKMVGMNTGLWKISQAANQKIHFNDLSTTTGTGGYISSTLKHNCVELVCSVANLEWIVTSSVGSITVV